jgi:hypothetical protein
VQFRFGHRARPSPVRRRARRAIVPNLAARFGEVSHSSKKYIKTKYFCLEFDFAHYEYFPVIRADSLDSLQMEMENNHT